MKNLTRARGARKARNLASKNPRETVIYNVLTATRKEAQRLKRRATKLNESLKQEQPAHVKTRLQQIHARTTRELDRVKSYHHALEYEVGLKLVKASREQRARARKLKADEKARGQKRARKENRTQRSVESVQSNLKRIAKKSKETPDTLTPETWKRLETEQARIDREQKKRGQRVQ